MGEYEMYFLIGIFVLMYGFGLYLLTAQKKFLPVAIYTLAYFSLSYVGYLINGTKGVVIAVEAVLIAMLFYLRYEMNKRVDTALKRLEEKEHTQSDNGDKKTKEKIA